MIIVLHSLEIREHEVQCTPKARIAMVASWPDREQTKAHLIETMVELLGSSVLAGKCDFALTAVPIAKLLCDRPSRNTSKSA